MNAHRVNLFFSSNQELSAFLSRAEALVHGTGDVGWEELAALGRLLNTMAPEMAEAAHPDFADAALQEQVQRYVAHLRSLQVALEQVRCVMLARRAKLDAARQHVEAVQGWANAYRQTA